MRDHGGNLDTAMARFGGQFDDWVDLSTGINPRPFPIPEIPASAWANLPTGAEIEALKAQAQVAYGTQAQILPLAGASAGIQLFPMLRKPGNACVLGPTYNEHAASLASSGWQVKQVNDIAGLRGAELAVVVNPNNPDGRRYVCSDLLDIAVSVGVLVVDESFADGWPELSLAAILNGELANVVVLRSFGKFFGLAGLRLGFALGGKDVLKMAEMAGPWPVSGAAIYIGCKALADRNWQIETFARLKRDAERLDYLAEEAGWSVVGGTELFRLYDAGDAQAAQEQLARSWVWSRIFPYSDNWIRLGLPDGEAGWAQVETALNSFR